MIRQTPVFFVVVLGILYAVSFSASMIDQKALSTLLNLNQLSFMSMNATMLLMGTLDTANNNDTKQTVSTTNEVNDNMQHPKFFLIPTPEITSDLLLKNQTALSNYYQSTLNEESAEVWLHRGFSERMEEYRTMDPNEADVFIITGFLHFARLKGDAKQYAQQLQMYNKTKPHVVLCPSWNPQTSNVAGITHLIRTLQKEGVNVWSVGLERNPSWQALEPERIIPIPYVVRPSYPQDELFERVNSNRTFNFVFYAGDSRKNAIGWAGCNRSMVTPLENVANMDVSLRSKANRLSQDAYNNRMFTSDYCLILCGDTVTSRSLTSSIVYGCIPVRVGSRLRGLCEAPCHAGWGWAVTGKDNPHLPYPHVMEWNEYPEVKEANFSEQPLDTLDKMFEMFTPERKARIRQNMLDNQMGWIYGWGDPVTSQEFGQATKYVWNSILSTLGLRNTSITSS